MALCPSLAKLVEVSSAPHGATVVVHDDEPGVPEELREKVLVPFFRRQADRSRKTGGVGLGLAIVNRIVQRHGGRIAIATRRQRRVDHNVVADAVAAVTRLPAATRRR